MTGLERSPEALEVARAGNGDAPGAAVEWLALGRLRRRRRAPLRRGRRPTRPTWPRPTSRAAPPELAFEPREALVAGPTGLEAIAAHRRRGARAPGARRLAADGGGRGPGAGGRGRAGATAGLARRAGRADLAGHRARRRGRAGARRERRRSRRCAGPLLDGRPRAASRPTRSTAWRRRSTPGRASRALYALKGRPRAQPCQVLLYSAALLDEALAPLDPPTRRGGAALAAGAGDVPGPRPRGPLRGRGRRAGRARSGCARPRMDGPLAALDLPWSPRAPTSPAGPTRRAVDGRPGRACARGCAAVVDAGAAAGHGVGRGRPARAWPPAGRRGCCARARTRRRRGRARAAGARLIVRGLYPRTGHDRPRGGAA